MSKADIDRVIKVFEKKYFAPLKGFNEYYWVGGGAIVDTFLNRPINDVDLYLPTSEIQEKALHHMEARGFQMYKKNPTHYKLTNEIVKYDLIHTWSTPEQVVAENDYEHCCVTIDKNLNFIYTENFFERLTDKKLIPTKSKADIDNFDPICKWPVSIIRRLLKLLNKGYTIDMKGLKVVCRQVIKLQDERKK
tara:strand:- start:9 stop:584 length:576 start_codon:yes stop_codon:yes gene_type:complete